MSSGAGRAYSAGLMIGQGLANGLNASAGAVEAAAARLASAANAAIEAKAKIGSPSRITRQYGIWYGQGFINGINRMISDVRHASEDLVYLPGLAFAQADTNFGDFNAELNDSYDYRNSSEYTINIPFDVDGKRFARATAKYNEAELNRAKKFKSKLGGDR